MTFTLTTMPCSKKKQAAMKLVQAKKNMAAPQTTKSRAPVDTSKVIENAGSESPPITLPPQLSPRTRQAAVDKCLESRKSGGTDMAQEYSNGAESKTEVLIQKKHQASSFHGGILDGGLDEGGDSRSDGIASRKGWQAGEDEDEKTSSEEDDSDGEVFPLKFSVPFNREITSMTIDLDIKYSDLLTKLADTMSIAPKHVHVTYQFRTQPHSDPYSHLLNTLQLMELISAAHRTILNTKSKKEFVVELKDLDAVASGKGKKADKKADKEQLMGPQKRGDSDSDNSEATSGEDEVNGKKVKSKKKSLQQLVVQLEINNVCDKYGGHGCLKFTTGHVKAGPINVGHLPGRNHPYDTFTNYSRCLPVISMPSLTFKPLWSSETPRRL
ncbi:hypothetical protein B0H10DRAFT_1941153 [Mycena sp. CBHHK59/15]|nr:hypothetical protein B0H10DRAFT_1941153 [Mycena sp. CBHHK59/15]